MSITSFLIPIEPRQISQINGKKEERKSRIAIEVFNEKLSRMVIGHNENSTHTSRTVRRKNFENF